MREPKTMLLVAYQFPPILSPTSMRMARFARYLPEAGWRPIVLTSENGISFAGEDPTELERLSDVVEVIRVPEWRPTDPIPSFARKVYARLAYPDQRILWALRALKRTRHWSGDLGIQLVFSTLPALSNHMVGRSTARRLGVPWVAEWVDLWSQNATGSVRLRSLARRSERKMLGEAAAVVAVTDVHKAELTKLAAENVPRVITVGHDPSDTPHAVGSKSNSFVVGHGGGFYNGLRDPAPFARALDSFAAKHPELAVEFVVISPLDEAIQAMRQQKSDRWELTTPGVMSFREGLQRLAACDVLLLIDVPGYPHVPMKFYDYLGVGRPMLALFPEDSEVVARLNRSEAGLRADMYDEEEIEQALETLLRERGSGDERRAVPEALMEYDYRLLTFKLAELFDEVIAKDRAGFSGRNAPS